MPGVGGVDPQLLSTAVFDARWSSLTRARLDVGTVSTWDPSLARDPRILIPIDVQAYVVTEGTDEPTVDVAGTPDDPVPFAPGQPRPPGVHLHWAMPDALLRGEDDGDGGLTMPPLPDRWVVVRTLLPLGGSRALVHGWVIDARSAVVTPLDQFDGTAPADASGHGSTLDVLDGVSGGSALWTSSYAASTRRFAVHDSLSDLASLTQVAPSGLLAHADYTVAGWWTDRESDPLEGATGPAALDARLTDLGWFVDHEDDSPEHTPADPRLARQEEAWGYRSVREKPPVEIVTPGRVERYPYAGVTAGGPLPIRDVSHVVVGPSLPTYHSLVHGAVVGVPIDGVLPAADQRPSPDDVEVAIGLDVDDVIAAFGTQQLDLDDDERRSFEQVLAAFAGGTLDRLASADGLADLSEREHRDGFTSFPGPALATSSPDRLRVEGSSRVNPTTVGRVGRSSTAPNGPGGRAAASTPPRVGALGDAVPSVSLTWASSSVIGLRSGLGNAPVSPTIAETVTEAVTGEGRVVPRAAPRLFRPHAPMVALRGARPSHRHHDDGSYDDAGLLCRFASQCVTALDGVVDGPAVVPTLSSGAVPTEVLTLVRETLLIDPYATGWLAQAGPAESGPATTRLLAEAVRLYGTTGTYDPSGRSSLVADVARRAPRPRASRDPLWSAAQPPRLTDVQLAAEISRRSLQVGTPPSPIGLTTWRQPWVPLWLEWTVTITGTTSMAGWRLDEVDLEPAEDRAVAEPTQSWTFSGRTPISEGVGSVLQDAVASWTTSEEQRELSGASLSRADVDVLSDLADLRTQLDLVSASLDGVREQLLGIPYVGHLAGDDDAGPDAPPRATGLPVPLVSGHLRLDAARLVDAFGRTLDVGVEQVATTTVLQSPDEPAGIRLRPRLQHAARWLFRLVDPAHPDDADPAVAPEAFVDQVRPDLAVNPVVGFLLPDHVDEALEVFDVTGAPLGQLMHDPITSAVRWEVAPGRPLPPDAGPMEGLDPHTRLLGRFATGVVAADVESRAADRSASSSTLSALLRAIDTTLWSVDTFAATGSGSVAGLVGRPIAVVRAILRLDAPDDTDELVVDAPGGPDARRAVFAALAEHRFPVRLGDLTRSDDSLLAFVVDDDYRHVHLVDKVVASEAWESGRHRGYLGLLGSTPSRDPLDHPYLVTEDTLWLRPGQTVRLTLLMLPAGSVHLTSGIVPTKQLALADDWVRPGMARLVPSLRVGPVLVDPAEIRMPLAHHLGEAQTFTRRTGPLTWRDDPITASSQAALLPRMPHEVAEGWVRVTPEEGSS